MSFKTVTCETCGDQVSKRSTVRIEEGQRACRTHKGVMAIRDRLYGMEQDWASRYKRPHELVCKREH